METKEKLKQNKAITLIALVITIIILLILTTITIVELRNTNLFNKTIEARNKYKTSAEEENNTLDNYANKINDIAGGATKNDNDAPTIEIVEIKKNGQFGIKAVVKVSDIGSGINYDKTKYLFNNSSEPLGTDESLYTDGKITSENQTITINKKSGNYYLHVLATDNNENKVEKISEKFVVDTLNELVYTYSGAAQSIDLVPGKYKMECWGANTGWKGELAGAYVSGEILLNENKTFYIYIGGNNKLFNFGYLLSWYNHAGGSTDIRLTDGNWDDTTSLRSRIMVAASCGSVGGSNSWDSGTCYGGYAGGLTGGNGGILNNIGGNTGASQTSGYSFGISTAKSGGAEWGGNGYYSGKGGGSNGSGSSGGGGGSSFISGHNGCNSVDANGVATGSPLHFSGYAFTNTKMIDSEGYEWTTSRQGKVGLPNKPTANSLDGFVRITPIN